MNWPLHIVDVFAAERYAGNPLAVVFATEGALDAATMQRIALETNYSETTFVAPQALADGAWRVRMFTPAREIAFAGHPILGTAWAIRRHLAPAAQALTLRLMQDDVHVRFAREADGADVAWFRAPPVTLGRRVDAARVAAALGLDAADIDPRAPVRQCAAGTAALVVPLASAAALARARLDLAAFAPLAAEGLAPLTYLVCREARAPQNQLRALLLRGAWRTRRPGHRQRRCLPRPLAARTRLARRGRPRLAHRAGRGSPAALVRAPACACRDAGGVGRRAGRGDRVGRAGVIAATASAVSPPL